MKYSLVGVLAVLCILASVGCATAEPSRVGAAEQARGSHEAALDALREDRIPSRTAR